MVTVETEKMSDIFMKYHLGNLPFAAVIHEFKEAEPLDALAHNHPFSFTTFIMHGWYVERIWYRQNPNTKWRYYDVKREEGRAYTVDASRIHQIIDMSKGGCYTMMIPQGEKTDWGFYEMPEGKYFKFEK